MNNLTHFFKRNSATILTVVGAVGVVATTVSAVKATPKAIEVLEKAEEEKGEKLTTIEKIKVAGPAYIPSAVIGMSTIACIFGANAMNKRQQASIMSAYAFLDASYKEYKNKIKDVYGDEANKKVAAEIAKDHVGDYVGMPEEDDEERIFIDMATLKYFSSTPEKVLKGFDCFNETLAIRGYASVNELYELIGAEPFDLGYEVGWSRSMFNLNYEQREPEVIFTLEMQTLDDGMEIYSITPDIDPSPEYLFY